MSQIHEYTLMIRVEAASANDALTWAYLAIANTDDDQYPRSSDTVHPEVFTEEEMGEIYTSAVVGRAFAQVRGLL